jgi:DNA-binding NtrC family response regulator/predicted ATPase/class 3 adenylate cyclase
MPHADTRSCLHPADRIVGNSAAIQALRAQIRHLAAFDTIGSAFVPTLLLHGETGTGKGLVARVIHDTGPRAAGPFITVNCAAIPETLLEVELFGFEAGTFTDAKRTKPGLFESASAGTLFLDEIDALPLPLQGKLLSALEEKRARRLGATESRQFDVKLIAATSADLSRRVAEGQFRPDLYHRLAVVVLEMPVLRERGEDILQLAQHFLRQYAEAHGLMPKRLSEEAAGWLRRYRWPGNVRELSHLMERVTLLCMEDVVGASTLERLCLPRPHPAVASVTTPIQGEAEPLVEPDRIRQALDRTGGNVVRAARLLGISRGVLRYRMRRYGLERPLGDLGSPTKGEERGGGSSSGFPAIPAFPRLRGGLEKEPKREGGAREVWEQKPVAVLAIDVTWPEALDPNARRDEPWTLAARWQRTIAEQVQGFGGLIVRHSPWPLTAVFGMPQTLEQMPQRAVQVALTFRLQMTEDGALDGRPPGPQVRMAIHVGQVLVDVQAHDPTAWLLPLGETLSLPVRLLGHAAPGDILLSPQVGRLVEGWFELHAREGSAALGISNGVGAYAVVGLGPRHSPLEVYGKRPLSRFVGRAGELAALRDLLARVDQGRGQVVGIVGEPGVGKSRLCYELIQSQQAQRWLILESSPVAYGKETPYLPVIDLLKAYFQLDARDGRQTTRDRIMEKLHKLGEDPANALPALLALLDIPVEDPAWQALDPPQRRQRTLEVCKHLLLRESQVQPVLLVMENLHWIDTATQAFLDSLVDSLAPARLLLLVTYRPDYRHDWGSKSSYTQIRLDPLSPECADELLQVLLGEDTSLAPLKPLLIGRTEGNPFFLEESVRTLVEMQALVGEPGSYRLVQTVPTLQVPATVQAVLAARIDRLPVEEKQLLQTAAVIGHDVPLALLQAIAELPEEALHRSLTQLQRAEFLYEARLFSEREYTFKHALTHAVAYGSLPQGRRRVLHARIVEALEELYADRLVEQVDRLAYHARQGELWEKAVAYCCQAGAKARDGLAYREALICFDQSLAALAHVPVSPAMTAQAIDLRLDLCVLHILGEYGQSLTRLSEAEVLARALNDRARLGRVLVQKTFLLRMMADHPGAIAIGQQALAIAAELGDRAMEMAAAHRLAQPYCAIGEFGQAAALLRQNLAALEAGAPDPNLTYGISSRAWLALVMSFMGEFAEGQHHGEEALRLAEGRGNLPSVAHGCLGLLYLTKGDLQHAIRVLDQGLAFCRATDNRDWSRSIAAGLGHAYALVGHIREGLPLLEDALRDDIRTGALHRYSDHIARFSEVCLLAGRHDEAWQHARRALDLARQYRERGYEALALRQLGAVYAHADSPDVKPAETSYRQALALAEALGMRPLVAHCHLGLGTLYAKAGQQEDAHTELSAAIDLYRSMDMTFWLPQAEAALAEVEGG